MFQSLSAQQAIQETEHTHGLNASSILELDRSNLNSNSEPKFWQSWCGNNEGRDPASPFRYDFALCFSDIWVGIIALYGIVFGLVAIWWLINRKNKREIKKDWHLWTKQCLIVAIGLSVLFQLFSQVTASPGIWLDDVRFSIHVLTIVSLGVIFTIQWLEHTRLRNPNGVVLFYWLLLIIAWSIHLRSLISQNSYRDSLFYFISFCIGYSLSCIEFLLEWLVPKKKSVYESLGYEDESPVEYATVFGLLTFSWMTPMMRSGYAKFLTEEDLWNLAKRDTSKTTGAAFMKAWNSELEGDKPSVWMAIFKAFSWPYFRGALFKVVTDSLAFVQPQLLRFLIAFVKSYKKGNPDPPQPISNGVVIALAMFAVSVGQTMTLHQYFQRAFDTGMRVKTALTSAIYAKSLKLSNEGRASKNTGDIVNYMAVDTQRLQDLSQYAQQIWSAPYQILLCTVSLYKLMGPSMFAGVGVMIFMIPINGLIARMMKKLQEKQMKNKDSRTRLTAEIINNMKSIKLYAWGNAFRQKLNFIRNERELKTLRKIGASQSVANFTWSTTPFLVSCATFSVYVLTSSKPLTTDIVFPALTLFNLLTFPLAILPMVITSIIESFVAVGRLRSFLLTEELQKDAIIFKNAVEENGDESVLVRDGTFSWDRYTDGNELQDINFNASKGELTCIVGRVGAGKSSFLQAMLGDMWKVEGKVVVCGKTAYVAQQPWIMNASVKENILFGHRYDPSFYDRTIHACALFEDFAQLPDGDETQVGERGISLSGGQKARLTLARAVYARADIYLLDDSLSAVDQHVGKHIIENVLGSRGILSGKTRILATNSIPVLMEADFIYLLRDGRIIERGTYPQIMAMKGEISSLVKTSGSQDQSREASNISSSISSITTAEENQAKSGNNDVPSELQIDFQPIRTQSSNRRESKSTLGHASTASIRGPLGKPQDEEMSYKTKQRKEFSEQGKVSNKVYLEYAKLSNLFAVSIYGILLICSQTASVAGNVWLKRWSEINDATNANPSVGKFIGIYFALGISGALLVVLQTMILWIFCSIEAARKLHERMAHSIFRAPMSFFETTPAGRILNRFSRTQIGSGLHNLLYFTFVENSYYLSYLLYYKLKDLWRTIFTDLRNQTVIYIVLMRTFNMLFVNSARSLFTLIVISSSTPAFIALIIPLSAVYYWIQQYYLRTSRELKRLDSVSRSPIYAHFQESLGGISTIRAYRQQERFIKESENRVDANLRAYVPSINANSAASFSIISVARGGKLTDGMVGLAMSYALQITQSLNWIVRQTVEVETNIVSVERILEYCGLQSEAAEVIYHNRPPISWPAAGAVQFNNFSTRYREGLGLVLKNINLDIKPHEKIGVVGRTGAGKSSLTLSLFRIIEPTEGNISIDDLNTSNIGLVDLRQRLAIIPQDAALFEGTVRDNLDPAHVHDDTELWDVLDHARLKEHISNMTGGLDAKVLEGGSNLSQGQRQLVSLARALLTPSNILVLDEATAAVDVQTDALIQATLRGQTFSKRTIITIAHRINTILDSDRIVVLEAGNVVEFDSPKKLLEKGEGVFWKLVKEAGLMDESNMAAKDVK